jgi:AcrR family transcriptional regulator
MNLRALSKASKRKAILRAASRLLAQRPFQEVLLEDVAAAAKVAKGTVYLYFNSKEQLYLSLMQESFEPLVRELKERASSADSAWDALQSVVRQLIEFADGQPAFREMLRVTTIESREAVLRTSIEQVVSLIEGLLAHGQKNGEFAECDSAITAHLVLGMVGKMNYMLHDGKYARPIEDVIRELLRMLARGLSVDRGALKLSKRSPSIVVSAGSSHE